MSGNQTADIHGEPRSMSGNQTADIHGEPRSMSGNQTADIHGEPRSMSGNQTADIHTGNHAVCQGTRRLTSTQGTTQYVREPDG